jgi:hypothetical protein
MASTEINRKVKQPCVIEFFVKEGSKVADIHHRLEAQF